MARNKGFATATGKIFVYELCSAIEQKGSVLLNKIGSILILGMIY